MKRGQKNQQMVVKNFSLKDKEKVNAFKNKYRLEKQAPMRSFQHSLKYFHVNTITIFHPGTLSVLATPVQTPFALH
jgi:hypothetical protein